MHNVGETATFTVSGGAADGSITYAWSWWDNTVDVTVLPVITKKLNVGAPGALPVVCEYCDRFGVSSTITTSITVNAPPVIVGSPTISVNDSPFPFNTSLSATAYDPEAAGTLDFLWYEGATPVGAGTMVLASAGTWRNTLALTAVAANRTLTQLIIDVDSGTTRMDYGLRGFAPTGLTGGGSSANNSITSTTNTLPDVTIGPGQQVTFTVYGQDSAAGQLQFAWELSANDGWASTYTTTDTPAQLANGSYRSQITRSVATETPGIKIAYCTVTNLVTGQVIIVKNTVQLNASQVPVISGLSTDAPLVSGAHKILRTGYVHFTGTATDRNNLLLDYHWDFDQPAGVTLWGRTVMLRPDQHPDFEETLLVTGGAKVITGNLTVTDRFGAATTSSIQSFVTVQVWPS